MLYKIKICIQHAVKIWDISRKKKQQQQQQQQKIEN